MEEIKWTQRSYGIRLEPFHHPNNREPTRRLFKYAFTNNKDSNLLDRKSN